MSDFVFYLLEFQLVRFVGAGGLATLVYYAIFLPLVERWLVRYYVAAAIATLPSFTLNFALQKYWAFGNESVDGASFQLMLFAVKNVVLFGANIALLWMLIDKRGMRPRYAQVIVTAVLTVVSFFASRWIFRT